jgi:DNA-binding transcriptional MocR family regulator
MDKDGLVPEALRQAIKTLRYQGRKIKFLYLIPNYQNPAGVLLPADRRTEILDICRKEKIFIVEDNPYGLLGFDRPSPNAMRAEDSENVIYLGSFSKTIVPGFRIGWALVPQALREKLVIASESSILCPSNFAQMSISSYLANQPWRDQIASFVELYRARRDAMLETLDAHFPKSATWTRPQGGFYVWVTLPPEIDTKAMMPKAIVAKVAYVPGTAFYADGLGSWSMRLSYCYPTPERIREGVKALAGVVEQEIQRRNSLRLN